MSSPFETGPDISEQERIRSTRIGIIGGGQLGLMLSEAARTMGYAGITVLDPTPDCPAAVIAEQIVGSLKDPAALRQLAERADILTYEIEHISTTALQTLHDAGVCIYLTPQLLGSRHFYPCAVDAADVERNRCCEN